MISLGLSAVDQTLFNQSLVTGYNAQVTVQVLDLSHRYIADVSAQLIDGQVNHNFNETVEYSASLTLIDPDNLVGFDTSSPSDNALYADRMIRIVYSVYSELLPRWVDVPIFCGPVTKVARDDAILSIECQGKESLVTEPTLAWTSKTYPKGSRMTAAIYNVMRTRAGETKFSFPEWPYALARNYAMTPETVIWTFVQTLAGSRNVRHLFYDGRGVLRIRDTPTRPSWTFSEDTLLSVPKLDYNHADIRNGATAKGATPEGKPQLRAHRYLPASHPSSPQALGRDGVPRIIMEIIEDTTLTTQAQVNALAQHLLNVLANANVGFDFDSFVIPHLEPGDIFHLSTRDVSINLRLESFSIPLRVGQPQSNGVVRKLSANKARLRRK